MKATDLVTQPDVENQLGRPLSTTEAAAFELKLNATFKQLEAMIDYKVDFVTGNEDDGYQDVSVMYYELSPNMRSITIEPTRNILSVDVVTSGLDDDDETEIETDRYRLLPFNGAVATEIMLRYRPTSYDSYLKVVGRLVDPSFFDSFKLALIMAMADAYTDNKHTGLKSRSIEGYSETYANTSGSGTGAFSSGVMSLLGPYQLWLV